MEKEQKVQSEKVKRVKKKKYVFHYLIVYLVCLLIACVTWLSVRYSTRAEQSGAEKETVLFTASWTSDNKEQTIYV